MDEVIWRRTADGKEVAITGAAAAAEEEEPEYKQVLRDMLEDKQGKIPVTAFPLHTAAGREGFLEQFAYLGSVAIFAAVAHVWDNLVPPKHAQAIELGLLAGSGGSGRTAIRKLLIKYLEEVLAVEFDPIPSVAEFNSFEEWNAAAMATFSSAYEREQVVVKHYAKILNGELPG